MAWTYNATPFAGTSTQNLRDSVRFLIGDTDTTDQQLQDGEVDGVLSQNAADVYQAAMECCVGLSARYARKASKTTGNLSIQAETTAKHYTELRAAIKVQSQRHNVATPYFGGISQADQQIDQQDDDLVQPDFAIGMDDHTGATIPEFNRAVPSG